jgi:2-polyprenyl-6-methoxyphenol hydroxylase-like FAD-dependent oxidoreductase
MRHDVLIAGAGPTGLVLALWLTKMGLSVRIISKALGPGTSSRALVVHARTLELYGQADLADAVVAQGYEVGGASLWVKGVRQAQISLKGAGAGHTRYPFVHIYPQDRHERLLVERLEKAGVRVEWNTTLLDFEDDEGRGVTVRVQMPDGSVASCEAAYLAGCDGASSTVRKVIGLGFPGDTYQQIFYVADVEAEGPPMNGELNLDLDSSDFLAVFPLDAGSRARLIGTVKRDAGETGDLRFEDVDQHAAQNLKIQVKAVHWFSTYRVHHRVTDRFRKGRAFLLGDAAHIHSPAGGQGMNTGIGDAVNLAWKIAMVLKGSAPDRLLDTYEEERMAFTRSLVRTTDQAFSLATSEGGLASMIRTRVVPVVMPLALRLEPLRERIFRTVSQLQINYRGDDLSDGEAGDVRGGDRLPWVELGGGGSNYDDFREMFWQAHVYGEAKAGLTQWCRSNGLRLNCFDWEKRYMDAGFARDAVYLVRPDTYVALADRAALPEKIEAYFSSRGIKLPLTSQAYPSRR